MPDPSTPENQPFPPASLSVLVSMLATQALMALGQMPNPATKQVEKHLPMARHLIDTIEMLEEKTSGNRNQEETKVFETALYQLRMIYVEEAKKA